VLSRVLWIAVAGAAGSVLRYAVSLWALRWSPALPLGTLAVNVVGSFLLGLLMEVGLTTNLIDADVRTVLAAGLLGGFTTYSSFNYETLEYLRRGSVALGWIHVGVTVAACLVAGGLGLALGKGIAGR
jgi:fluoride exporter